jgi:hypothetical protein
VKYFLPIALLLAAGIAVLASPPAMAFRTAPPTIDHCPYKNESKTDASLNARIEAFWKQLDSSLYSFTSARPGVIAALVKHWVPVLLEWEAYAKSKPGAAEESSARVKWHQAVETHRDAGVVFFSNAQLEIFRCYLRIDSENKLDGKELAATMKEFALATYAADTTSLSGRMNSFRGWFEWNAFADSYFAISEARRSPIKDQHWEQLERGILYGALLHAHHDTFTGKCGGMPCPRWTDLKPPGLADTSKDGIRRYCYEQLDQAGVREVMRILSYRVLNDPRAQPLRLPPSRPM